MTAVFRLVLQLSYREGEIEMFGAAGNVNCVEGIKSRFALGNWNLSTMTNF